MNGAGPRDYLELARSAEAGIALFEQPRTPDDVLFKLLDDENATTEFRIAAPRERAVRSERCQGRVAAGIG